MTFKKEPKVNENSHKKCLMMSNKTQPLILNEFWKRGLCVWCLPNFLVRDYRSDSLELWFL